MKRRVFIGGLATVSASFFALPKLVKAHKLLGWSTELDQHLRELAELGAREMRRAVGPLPTVTSTRLLLGLGGDSWSEAVFFLTDRELAAGPAFARAAVEAAKSLANYAKSKRVSAFLWRERLSILQAQRSGVEEVRSFDGSVTASRWTSHGRTVWTLSYLAHTRDANR